MFNSPGFGFDAISVVFERLPLDSAYPCEENHRCDAQKAEYKVTIGGRRVKRICRQAADIHARLRGFVNAEDACARSGKEANE